MARDPQLNPTAYFEAAMSILRSEGYEGLTIQAMCERLGVTKGSFYHHFEGMGGFVVGLMEFWEAEQTTDLFDAAEAEVSSLDRSRLILTASLELDHEAERSIRVWSTTNDRVATTLRRVDTAREERVRRIWESDGLDSESARVAAKMGLAILIGYQNSSTGFDLSDLEDSLATMTEAFRSRIRARRSGARTDPAGD